MMFPNPANSCGSRVILPPPVMEPDIHDETMVSLSSTISSEQAFTLDNDKTHHHNIREVSFSCYLNDAEENLIRKLAESTTQSLNPTQENSKCHVSKSEDDGEIGVFGAEKYFKEGMDNDEGNPKPTKLSTTRSIPYMNHEQVAKKRSESSIRSESSYNSQSALLKNVPKIPSRRKSISKTRMKNFLAGLGCSCLDKDSIDIDQNSAKESITKGNRDPKGTLPVKIQLAEEVLELPRQTLDVFGSPGFDIQRKSLTLERKLNVLSWNNNTPPIEKKGSYSYNDNDSDASSDLFEIDSLSGKANDFPGTYEPSEASIEWSVVTASMADFGVTSDYEEISRLKTKTVPIPKIKPNPNSKTRVLMGCNTQKATRIVENSYKTPERGNLEQRMRRVSDSFMPLTRIKPQVEPMGFIQRQQPSLAPTHSLPPAHSPQYNSARLLYI
ncbi:hypothetical protein ACFE04_024852 [Oxalis oulophora]